MKIDVCTVGPFQENCYLVVDETTKRAVLIDPGEEGDRILEMITRSGASLDAIWLTHAHLDHIGALEAVRRVHPVPVYLHPLDLPFYESLSARAAVMYGLSFVQPTVATLPLADGDELACGSLRFRVMHAPGHAPGLVSFNGHGVTLAGDLLFAGSIGRTDLPLADPYAMERSLDRVLELDDSTVVYPGHGLMTSIGAERTSNPFLSGRARPLKR